MGIPNSPPIMTRVGAILVGVETEMGKAVPIEECEIILVTEQSRTSYAGDTAERTRKTEVMQNYEQVNTAPYATVTIGTPWSGSGVPPTESEIVAPAIGMLARGCKRVEVQDLENGVLRYEPTSGEGDSLTIYYLQDGELQCLPGARGTLTGFGQSKGYPSLSWTFTGLYQRPRAVEKVSRQPRNQADEIAINYQNTKLVQLGGVDFILQSLSFDLGNTVVHRTLPNYEGVHVTDKKSSGQLNFQAPRIGDYDTWERVESHKVVTKEALKFEHGTEAGNIIGLEAPATQLTGLSESDSDGFNHYQTDLRFLPVEGDDELVLTFR